MLPSANSFEGKPVPTAIVKTCSDNQWLDVSTDAVFAGSRRRNEEQT